MVEPPRTHSNLPCRPASPFVTVVRGGSVGSNYPKLTPTFPVGLFSPLLQCFEKVRCIRTSPNSLEPNSQLEPLNIRSTVILWRKVDIALALFRDQLDIRHSGSRRFGGVEPPQTHSNVPCRPVSPFVTVIRGGSVYSNLPYRAGSSELVAVRPHRTS